MNLDDLHALRKFQQEAVEGLGSSIAAVARQIERQPESRRTVAIRNGVMLLEAPTGSGKTLMLGRSIESVVGALPMKTIWFWFAPYGGLVTQTREALAAQCPRLRIRDLLTDRFSSLSRDGDIFISTWSLVATSNLLGRKVRRGDESVPTLDSLITAIRADGYSIGVVVDEAHLNFGASAKVAAQFYLNDLQPDFTLLATATPNDERLEAFEREAGVAVATRITIDRSKVVKAGLNKRGLRVGLLRFRPEDADLIDPEMATLTAGWRQHQAISSRLAERGIGVTPLMLVQVEDRAKGEADPVERVKNALLGIGVPESVIATHTSGEPDPEFHTLAYDPARQVLIFKVSVATGFDAPRAWTLVSVRPNRGRDFGLQIVGRIMRVHPAVRPIHGQDSLLDRGYVFLTDPDVQAGLHAAAEELKAVKQGMELLTDRLDFDEIGTAEPIQAVVNMHTPFVVEQVSPADQAERELRLASLIAGGIVPANVARRPTEAQDRAILLGELVHQTPLFQNLPEQAAHAPNRALFTGYRLNRSVGLPLALLQERPLAAQQLNSDDFIVDVARVYCSNSKLLQRLHEKQRQASITFKDLFLNETEQEEKLNVRLSDARVAEKAQAAFQFNDSIDVRLLKRALVKELRRKADEAGLAAEEQDLRRAIDLAAMVEPKGLREAVKEAQAKRVIVSASEPLPQVFQDYIDAAPAVKAAYGIFPSQMNKPERRLAEILDNDGSGTVRWWLKNVENALWATRIILPTGRQFFPDFAVGVQGRRTPDGIALIEVKDDGVDGRLHADLNIIKIRSHHREYREVAWVTDASGGFERLGFNEGLNRIVPLSKFEVSQLVV